jgi:UrcA family protein
MIDRLILTNGALLVVTTLVCLACLHPGASGGHADTTPAAMVVQRQPAVRGPEVSIRLDDVDLATQEGSRGLLVRIRRAARTLCAAARLAPTAQDECVRETTDQVVAELCNPALAAANAAGRPTRD